MEKHYTKVENFIRSIELYYILDVSLDRKSYGYIVTIYVRDYFDDMWGNYYAFENNIDFYFETKEEADLAYNYVFEKLVNY